MDVIEVYADVACPFAYAGLRKFRAHRSELRRHDPLLWVRAWPLELVNGQPHRGPALAPKVEALRSGVAPDLFAGFDPSGFPGTTLPSLAAEAAAYTEGVELGERFSFALRIALFEEGLDVSHPEVLRRLCRDNGVPEPTEAHRAVVLADYEEGKRRGARGSPHFFTRSGSFFCPTLDIQHEGDAVEVAFDVDGYQRFISAVFA